jgi:hypothetical protein
LEEKMKISKKVILALLAFSVLPGCGKKNDDPVVTTAPIGGVISGGVALNGNCYTFSGVPYGQGATVTFSGSATASGGLLQGTAQAASVGLAAVTFTRSNNINGGPGDSMQVYFNGSSIQVAANLAPSTVMYFQAYNMPLCALEFNTTVSGGFGGTVGTLDYSSRMLTYSNYYSGISL